MKLNKYLNEKKIDINYNKFSKEAKQSIEKLKDIMPGDFPDERFVMAFDNVIESIYQDAYDKAMDQAVIIALEQRCERGTPWDRACVAIADKIRGK